MTEALPKSTSQSTLCDEHIKAPKDNSMSDSSSTEGSVENVTRIVTAAPAEDHVPLVPSMKNVNNDDNPVPPRGFRPKGKGNAQTGVKTNPPPPPPPAKPVKK